MQMADEVPESSGADGFPEPHPLSAPEPSTTSSAIWRVPGQIADEFVESSGADSQNPSKIFQAVGDNT